MRALLLLLIAVVAAACAPRAAAGGTASRRELTLLHLADLHSHLFPERVTLTARDVERGLGAEAGATPFVGGAARIATILERERAHADVAVTLDAGDLLEGTAVFTLFGGVPEMRVVDALGVDAAALGNHDFAPGLGRLAELRRLSPGAPLLAANLVRQAAGLVVPSVLVERGGVRVRVIGLGRSPEGDPDVAACATYVQRLIDDGDDTDAVVVLSHLGSDLDEALVPLTTGMDVVLGGHTHDVLYPPREVRDCGPALAASRGCRPKPVLVAHSGAYGRYVGRVSLVLSPPAELAPGRRGAVIEARYALLPVTEEVEERPEVVALLEPYRRAMSAAGLDRPLATAPRPIARSAEGGGDSALGNLVARAMRRVSGADLAVVNATGIRDDLPAGPLTAADFFRVLPFEDRVVSLELSGAVLLDAIERARVDSCARDRESQLQIDGAALTLACEGRGSAVLRVGGHPVDRMATYRVATVSFLTEPGRWFESRGKSGAAADCGPVRDALFDLVGSLAPCGEGDGGGELPCLDGRAGALADGRITWR